MCGGSAQSPIVFTQQRDQSRANMSDSDAATSSSFRNMDTFHRRQGYKRPQYRENVRKDDSKRRPGPRTDQGAIGQPPVTNLKGNRSTSGAVAASPSGSSSTITLVETDPSNVLINKDNVDPNSIRAIGVLDQYACRPS